MCERIETAFPWYALIPDEPTPPNGKLMFPTCEIVSLMHPPPNWQVFNEISLPLARFQ